jgi:hypothetical protein
MTTFNDGDIHFEKKSQKQLNGKDVTKDTVEKWQEKMRQNEESIFFGIKFDNDAETDSRIKHALYSIIGKRGNMGQFYVRVKNFFDKQGNIEAVIEDEKYKKFQQYLFNQGIIQAEEWPLLEIALRVIARTDLVNNENFKKWDEYNNKIEQQRKPMGSEGGIYKKQKQKPKPVSEQQAVTESGKEISSEVVRLIENKINNIIDIDEGNELIESSEMRALIIRDIIKNVENRKNPMWSMNSAKRFRLIDDNFVEKLHKHIAKLKN